MVATCGSMVSDYRTSIEEWWQCTVSTVYVERLGTAGVKVFEKGSKHTIMDLHDNVRPHVCHETKGI
ncbi:hypothetical protein TNCV_3045601 [Trichonephila clavipes]|uniref:Uncharacterized protein n=1 Tax=Trichonephila clavipes TaxID=2585209 RepID=A0A8X6RH58_TRICX|nr:hypothetical protein TNCV_3045601 [Trichonephila clavipes]